MRRRRVREQGGSFIAAQKRLLAELKTKGWSVAGDTASRQPGSVERIQIEPVFRGAIHYWGPVRATRVALGHSSDGWADIRKISADDILRWVSDEQSIEYGSMREPGTMPRMHLAEEARRRGRHTVPELSLSDTRLSIWEERDRSHVELINAKSDSTVIEWWDDQVREAIEDGFLDPRKMHQSAYDYAVHVGLIRRPGATPGRAVRENPVGAESKGDYEVWVDGKELLYSGPNRSEANYRFIMAAVNYKIGNVVERNSRHVELMVIGARGKRETMVDSKKLTDRQLQQRWEQKGSSFSFRENPVEARDYDSADAALARAYDFLGAEWYVRKGDKITVYAEVDHPPRGWSKAELVKSRGLFHWPAEWERTLVSLPKGAQPIAHLEKGPRTPGGVSREARECGCEHGCGENRDTNWAVEWINPTTNKRQIYFDDMSLERAEDEARRLRVRAPDADVRVVRRGFARENPVDEHNIPWVTTERDPKAHVEAIEVQNKVGPISGARSVYDLLSPWALKQDQEHLLVVLLDIHGELKGVALIHKGSRDRVSVDPSDVLRPAIDRSAAGLVLVHNHPSGQAAHSAADADLTKAIREACEAANIAMVDHVVLGTNEFYSFSDKKLTRVKSR